MSTPETYTSFPQLLDRACTLRKEGYIILVLDGEKGYSAFRPLDIQKRDKVDEDGRVLLLEGDLPASDSLQSSLKTIYQ